MSSAQSQVFALRSTGAPAFTIACSSSATAVRCSPVPKLRPGEDRRPGQRKPLPRLIAQPDVHRENAECLRHDLRHRRAQLVDVDERVRLLRQVHPCLAVVVERPLEMPGDDAPDALLQPVGEDEGRQPGQREQDEQGIEGQGPLEIQEPHHVGQDADDDQVDADQESGQRVLDSGARQVDVDVQEARPHQSPDEQDVGRQERGRVQDAQRGVEHGIDQRLAADVNPDGADAAHAEDDELDLPADVSRRRAQGALQVRQDERRAAQEETEEQLPGEPDRHNALPRED